MRQELREHPAVRRAALTNRQLETMLAILIRNPRAFAVARTHLQPRDFARQHMHYAGLWIAVVEHFNEHHTIPSEALLMGELERRISEDPAGLSAEEITELDEFIQTLYAVDVSQLHARAGISLLKTYLSERLTAKLREEVGTAAEAPQDLFGLLSRYSQQAHTVKMLEPEGVAAPFPQDWTYDEMEVEKLFTGVDFLDKMLMGGIGRGEVIGILGPYGSCKTTLAIQASTTMAIHAAGVWTSRGGRGPLDFCYYFFWEHTMNQVRLRALSCAGRLDRGLLESGKGKFEELRDATQPLKPYEIETFDTLLKYSQRIPSEQERLATARRQLNRNWRCLSMNGSDPANPGRGGGMIDEIVSLLLADRQRYRARGVDHRVGVVVVDYVGEAVRRHCSARELDPTRYTRTLIKDFVSDASMKLAIPFRCGVILMHQLNGEANDARPGAMARGNDAAECKSFAENLDFSFVIGKPTAEQVVAIKCAKHRRTSRPNVETVKILGNISRVESTRGLYRIERAIGANEGREAIDSLRRIEVESLLPTVDEAALQGLKFSACLPVDVALGILQWRLRDGVGISHALQESTGIVSQSILEASR